MPGTAPSPTSTGRTRNLVLATAAAIFVCRYVPKHGFVMAVAGALAAIIVYGVTLVLTGELGRADLERVRAIGNRRRKA